MIDHHRPNRHCSLRVWLSQLSLCGLLLFSEVSAASGGGAHQLIEWQQSIGPEKAANIVQANVEGKVLSVSSGRQNGRPVYRVKVLLSGGRVKVMQVSASDGQLLD